MKQKSPTSTSCNAPPSRIFTMHSSSLCVPNSFSSVAWLASSWIPCAPCLESPISHRGKKKQKRGDVYKSGLGGGGGILVRHENLKAINHLRQRDRAVVFPIVERLGIIDVYDKIFFLALEMNLGLKSVSTSHAGFVGGGVGACAVWGNISGTGPV